MKKLVFLFVLVSTLNFSFGQYTDTQIANSIRKSMKLNPGVSDPDSIYPNQTLWFLVPVDVVTGDSEWKILEIIGNAVSGDRMAPEYFKPDPKPQPVVEPVPIVQPEVKNYDYLWWAIIISCLFLGFAIYFLLKALSQKKNVEEHYDRMLAERNEANAKLAEIERELQATKNKLPIIPPFEGVDEEWLAQNNPVGTPIEDWSDGDDIADALFRVHGKTPDLIAQVLVSTEGNAVSMNFSHDRKAITDLKDVVVYLGWDWDKEKLAWIEVGRWAGVCSNGFVANPDQVVKGELFTKIELVDPDRHPIVFMSENVPDEMEYPEIIWKLIVDFHNDTINDLRNAGVVIKTR